MGLAGVSWYNNEWGYSCSVVDLIAHMANADKVKQVALCCDSRHTALLARGVNSHAIMQGLRYSRTAACRLCGCNSIVSVSADLQHCLHICC